MIFNRLAVVASYFGLLRAHPGAADPAAERMRAAGTRAAAQAKAHRWQKALVRDPALKSDLIEMGGVLLMPPLRMSGGAPQPASQDLYQCGREAGRRELALQLLALSGLTLDEFSQLMEDDTDV